MNARNKRAAILAAAAGIVKTAGAGHLTMDAVAAAASLSKGGVLYHFPSKQALLEGMLERLLEEITARADAYQKNHPEALNARLMGRIIGEYDQQPVERAMSRAFLAAAAEDPGLLAPAREAASVAFEEAAAGCAPKEMGWTLLLATEGLRFLEMFDLLPLSPAERDQVHQHLLNLAKDHAA
ncbi:MAG: TetR family transcriptional regulator [Pseudomonadales bacterium]|nr:TetR family transcriptional regulator [Pseudomonadales bacterium]